MTSILVPPSCSMTGTHCHICARAWALICCECGQALVPFHPDIEWLFKDKVVSWL
ncbi:hypothetical protein SEA_MAGRITTE_65 [Microbacterium phage Magritte]|nr:hypothetical protein SEA_MAGRITTE_65 [Microbacterium phage Magritte]